MCGGLFSIDARDLAKACRLAAERPLPGCHVFFVGSGESLVSEPLCSLYPKLMPAIGNKAAGLTGVALAEMVARSDVIVSVCPPHAALDVARLAVGYGGLYLDANAISPGTARQVAAIAEAGGADYVDGGIVGPPPLAPGDTRLYLEVEVRRGWCRSCGAVKQEKLPWVSPTPVYTNF